MSSFSLAVSAIDWLPPVNATLNGFSAILLFIAWRFIRNRKVRAHAGTMIAALISSATFLACYLTYHYLKVKSGVLITRFPDSPWRPVYLAILTSHTILAIIILPMIATTLTFAAKRQWTKHRWIARPTFWFWSYVSITGVVVYFMLYHLAPMVASK